jgi:hypothetical protein
MLQKNGDDGKELLTAQVTYSDAPHISPHHRGKRDVVVPLYQDHFLWAEDGDTVGLIRICSQENEIVDLICVSEKYVGKTLACDDHYFLNYVCPASGMTVQQELQQVVPRTAHRSGKAGRYALGCLARFLVGRLISDSLRVIRNSKSPWYFDVLSGNKWFDAPIKRHHLRIRTVGDLRRAGHLKSSFQEAAIPPARSIVKPEVVSRTLR